MDREWRLDTYKETVTWVGIYQAPNRDDLLHFSSQAQALTKRIIGSPYCVTHWSARAHLLQRLRYPELSVGDAYKVRLLLEAVKARSDLGDKVILAHREFLRTNQTELRDIAIQESLDIDNLRAGILDLLDLKNWICLVEGLFYAHATADSLDVCREGLKIYPNDPGLLWWREVIEEHLDLKRKSIPPTEEASRDSTIRNGGVYMRQYPWMSVDELRRSDSLVEKLKNEFVEASKGKCTVDRTCLSDHDRSAEDLGVFATQDIPADDIVLIDVTSIGVSNDPNSCPTCFINLQDRPPDIQCIFPAEPRSLPCCNERYCSSICATLALQTFHPPICGTDLSFLPPIRDPDTSRPPSDYWCNSWPLLSRLLLRCIAFAVHTDTHPLYTTLLSRFKASYTGDHRLIFNFSNIVDAFKILQNLNIDIFADLRFDTWVLHTIQCRIANNKSGIDTTDGYEFVHVNPLYCFLNHDCEPNSLQLPQMDTCSIEFIVAKRDIKKGEQIFTSYLSQEGLDLPWEARQEELFRWIRGDCGCERCMKEAPKGLLATL
ncbi:hypothetical protein BDZ45DRAFT_809872 [Acephala macrosclerotiorum]|nr:hypothetical protein BDZ45DRAFT_809872 [Acephala macrosclerotiorum]